METQRHFSSLASHNRGHNTNNQSQWLHKTLSDLDVKMKTLMNLIQENGDNRGESYDKRKPELIEMLQELGRSYQNLAQKHDQLRSKSVNTPTPSISSSCNLKRVSNTNTNTINKQNVENTHYDPKHEVVDSLPEPDSTNLNHEHLNKTSDHELKSSEQSKNISKYNSKTLVFRTDSFERDNTWSELKFQVTKLLEENLQQQAELLRRNAEKREAIKELKSRLEYVKAENRALQNRLRYQKVDAEQNQNQISRLKRQFSLRFLGCSS